MKKTTTILGKEYKVTSSTIDGKTAYNVRSVEYPVSVQVIRERGQTRKTLLEFAANLVENHIAELKNLAN